MRRPGSGDRFSSSGLTNSASHQITQCNDNGSNSTCALAQYACNNNLLDPLSGSWDDYYVPAPYPDDYPPDLTDWLNSHAQQIGASTSWVKSNYTVYDNFWEAGSCDCRVRPVLHSHLSRGDR